MIYANLHYLWALFARFAVALSSVRSRVRNLVQIYLSARLLYRASRDTPRLLAFYKAASGKRRLHFLGCACFPLPVRRRARSLA